MLKTTDFARFLAPPHVGNDYNLYKTDPVIQNVIIPSGSASCIKYTKNKQIFALHLCNIFLQNLLTKVRKCGRIRVSKGTRYESVKGLTAYHKKQVKKFFKEVVDYGNIRSVPDGKLR